MFGCHSRLVTHSRQLTPGRKVTSLVFLPLPCFRDRLSRIRFMFVWISIKRLLRALKARKTNLSSLHTISKHIPRQLLDQPVRFPKTHGSPHPPQNEQPQADPPAPASAVTSAWSRSRTSSSSMPPATRSPRTSPRGTTRTCTPRASRTRSTGARGRRLGSAWRC